MTFSIRKELRSDVQGIHEVTVAAFLDAPHSEHTEQFILEALPESGALSISPLAEDNEAIVGHVALSPVVISDGTENWYGLGPISVLPMRQDQYIGSKLMNTAMQELKKINAKGCLVLGEPDYHQRVGFKPIEALSLLGVPPEYFQALVLEGSLPRGRVTYHASFSAKC